MFVMRISAVDQAVASDESSFFWREKANDYEASIKYEKASKRVAITYHNPSVGKLEKWAYDVSSFERVTLAQSLVETSLRGEKAPQELISVITSKLEELKYLDSSSCRVLHLPVIPLNQAKTNQYYGILEELVKRDLASSLDKKKIILTELDDKIYRTQKLFQIVTFDNEEYEILVALDEHSIIKALSINKDGESLANHLVQVNEDSVVIRDKDGRELFSYLVDYDQGGEAGSDVLWLTIFSARNELGLSQKENFRIHTDNGTEYTAYRYKTLNNLSPEDIVRFEERSGFDSSLLEFVDSLREEFSLRLVLPEKIENCTNQKECSLHTLLETVLKEIVSGFELPIKAKSYFADEYKKCLEEEEVLIKLGNHLVASLEVEKRRGVVICTRLLGLITKIERVKSFLSSRFLSLSVDSKLDEISNLCLVKENRGVLLICSESIQKFQRQLIEIQPSFHQSFLEDIEQCLEPSKLSKIQDRVEALDECTSNQYQKYVKANKIAVYINLKEKMPEMIQERFSSNNFSAFLEECNESNCIHSYFVKQYDEKIIPTILDNYIVNDAYKISLGNRLMRKLRRIHREDLSPEDYFLKLKEFESQIVQESMIQGIEILLLEEMYESDPSLFEKDEQGKITRAAETYNYERAEGKLWREFLSFKNLPLLESVDESLKSYINKAVRENGIEGGRSAANQLLKDFYLWSVNRRNEIILSLHDLYEDKELSYRLEDARYESEECFGSYRPTFRDQGVKDFIEICEIKRLKSLAFYRGKKVFEKEISKYFDLQTIKANELMGINRFLQRCLRDKEKSAKDLGDFKTGAKRCLSVVFIDLKQNIYKYQALDKNLNELAKGNTIYEESFTCLKGTFTRHKKFPNLEPSSQDGITRLIDFSYSAPTTIRYMSSIYSSIGYESIENYEKYRRDLSSFFDQLSSDECEDFIKELDEGCFNDFENARIRAVRDGVIKLAGLDSLNLTTNLNESAQEVFADAIDLELVKMLLNDDYLLNEELYELRVSGNSPDTQYFNKKMTIDFLINTVNALSNLLKEGFYTDPDQTKTALVTFSSRLKELIKLAKSSKKPFHIEDLLGVLQEEPLFDTLAIGYLSKYMRQKINTGLLEFRDEQIKQNNIRRPDVKRLVDGQIRSENIFMRNAVIKALRSDRNYRASGINSSSSDQNGREMIKLIKEKIILPQLLGGEPTVETLDDLNRKIVEFFEDRQNSNIFFSEAASEFRNNTYIMTRESQWAGTGISSYFKLSRERSKFTKNFNSSIHRTSFIHKLANLIFIESFRRDNGHFKDILSQEWQRESFELYNSMQRISK